MKAALPCAPAGAALEYACPRVMLTALSPLLARVIRTAVAVVVVALVAVPAIARATQHVDRRDSTRLSIRESWIGVAPPKTATVAAPLAVAPATPHALIHVLRAEAEALPDALAPARHVRWDGPDPLRGPPAVFSA
ncbi:MAG TPA: hypothetical protein VG871_15430 [Vicinamibacterales bacterium]|nr:hypothetical protein [Vicinamibacterales bacterium]